MSVNDLAGVVPIAAQWVNWYSASSTRLGGDDALLAKIRHAPQKLSATTPYPETVPFASSNIGFGISNQLSKPVKTSDIDVRACGKRTADAVGRVDANRPARHDGFDE